MILAGAVVAVLVLFLPETYGPVLLSWKANHLRNITGDERYRAPHDLLRTNLAVRLLRSIARPIKFLLMEPIVDLFSLYLVRICRQFSRIVTLMLPTHFLRSVEKLSKRRRTLPQSTC